MQPTASSSFSSNRGALLPAFSRFRYGWGRLTHHAAAAHWGDAPLGSWRRSGWAALRRAENGYRLAALANLLVFLRGGKYRQVGFCGLLSSPPSASPAAGWRLGCGSAAPHFALGRCLPRCRSGSAMAAARSPHSAAGGLAGPVGCPERTHRPRSPACVHPLL